MVSAELLEVLREGVCGSEKSGIMRRAQNLKPGEPDLILLAAVVCNNNIKSKSKIPHRPQAVKDLETRCFRNKPPDSRSVGVILKSVQTIERVDSCFSVSSLPLQRYFKLDQMMFS